MVLEQAIDLCVYARMHSTVLLTRYLPCFEGRALVGSEPAVRFPATVRCFLLMAIEDVCTFQQVRHVIFLAGAKRILQRL